VVVAVFSFAAGLAVFDCACITVIENINTKGNKNTFFIKWYK
jgi:hypothetical protein